MTDLGASDQGVEAASMPMHAHHRPAAQTHPCSGTSTRCLSTDCLIAVGAELIPTAPGLAWSASGRAFQSSEYRCGLPSIRRAFQRRAVNTGSESQEMRHTRPVNTGSESQEMRAVNTGSESQEMRHTRPRRDSGLAADERPPLPRLPRPSVSSETGSSIAWPCANLCGPLMPRRQEAAPFSGAPSR